MPYRSVKDLPSSVSNVLPKHAQDIYLKAFNNAFVQYKDKKKRKDDSGLEETAARVAWSAVKQKYRRGEDGLWHEILE